jgi:hypothetical protein
MDGQGEAQVQKAIGLALDGDGVALRLCLERLVPPRRHRPVQISVPQLRWTSDAITAMRSIVTAAATGQLTPGEAGDLAGLVTTFVKTIETAELEQRVLALGNQQTHQA